MGEVHEFGTIVLLVAAAFSLAVVASRFSERLAIPAPAIFLLAAALISDIFPSIGERLTIRTVERIGVIALIVILFDGGTRIGLRRLRVAALPVLSLGVLGEYISRIINNVRRRPLYVVDSTDASDGPAET